MYSHTFAYLFNIYFIYFFLDQNTDILITTLTEKENFFMDMEVKSILIYKQLITLIKFSSTAGPELYQYKSYSPIEGIH